MSNDSTFPLGNDLLHMGFFTVELSNGSTFDPLHYLVAAREHESLVIDGIERSWEDIYKSDLALLAYDLISIGKKVTDDPSLRDAIFMSVLRIAETLPPAYTEGGQDAYGSSNGLFSSVFWVFFESGDYEKMKSVYGQCKDIVSGEAQHYMEQAVKDPEEYKKRLDNTE